VVDLLTRVFTIESKEFIAERFETFIAMVDHLSKA